MQRSRKQRRRVGSGTSAKRHSRGSRYAHLRGLESLERRMLLTGTILDAPVSASFDQATLESIADVAAQRWRATGLTAAQSEALDAIDYGIFDLGSNALGAAQGYAILVDDDAAGKGWFIDATPWQDEEFSAIESTVFMADEGSASGAIDLLTTVMHEQGHVLGLLDTAANRSDLMFETLSEGERRLPTADRANGAEPGSVTELAFIKLNDALPTGGHAWNFLISPDSSRVVYLADGDTDGVDELYSRAVDGSGTEVKLNDALPAGGNVFDYLISPDSSWVVYHADGDTDNVTELYSRAIDGSGSEVKLHAALPFGGAVNDFLISPDSSRVVYRADGDTDGVFELYSRAIDGSGSEVKLNAALPAGGDVFGFHISPDSSKVVYRADGDTDGVVELYSRAIDGSGSEVKLNDALLAGGNVNSFLISPDSSNVVYSANRDTDNVAELYSRPIDGSGSEVKLNATLPADGDVLFDFLVSPDSSRVVYRADGDTDGVVELYSRAIDGSGSEVKLNDALPTGGDVNSFLISPDSTRVVYHADGDTAKFELYSRAIDGSGSEVKLNAGLPTSGDVFDFLISPDASRVVYRADGDTDGVVELYSRAIDGSGSEVKLNAGLPAGGNVNSFLISPDSSSVVYSADGDTDNVAELYSRAIDGSGSEVKLSAALPTGGEVFDFLISPDSSNVVYRADGDTDGITELYSEPLLASSNDAVPLYLSFATGATLPGGLTFDNEDILAFDGTDLTLFFDGSDVGIHGASLDGFAVISANEILLSFRSPETIPGITLTVEDSDIVKFTATGLGEETTGTFELFFRGSDVGLSPTVEDIDAIELHDDGRLIVSTTGSFDVPGVTGKDEDLIAFTPDIPGDYSSGTWEMYFDAGDVGLGAEDVDAVALDSDGRIHLSTKNAFAVSGVSGDNEDVLTFLSSQLGTDTAGTYISTLLFDGSQFGLDASDVSGIDFPMPAASPGVTIGSGPIDVAEGTFTDSYVVMLDSVPTADVEITVTPDSQTDLGAGPGASIVLTFTPSTARTPQTVNVTAVDDAVAEGPHTSTITHTTTSADSNYDGVTINSVTANITDNDTAPLYLSFASGGTLPGGLVFENEDILNFDGTDFSLFFDGSDVGIHGASLDAFAVIAANEILMSFRSSETIPGITLAVEDSDIVKFTATGLGEETSGTFELFFRGSDVGLSPTANDIDAVDLHADGRLIVSTTGSFDVGGVTGGDEDLIAFTPGALSDYSSGTWALYFDGSNVGLGAEDVDAVALDADGRIHLSTKNAFAVTGASGDKEDVLTFVPSQLGADTSGVYTSTLLFDGSLFGLDANDVSGIDLSIPPIPPAPPSVTISGTIEVAEETLTDSYVVVLDSVPTADVEITVTPDSQTDLGAGPGTAIVLTFTPSTALTPQTVNVAAVNDAVVEGPHTSTITHTASSADSNYDGIAINSVTANITDNDTAAVTIEDVTALEGTGLLFTVTLDNTVSETFDVVVNFADVTATGGPAVLDSPEDYANDQVTLTFVGTAGETQQFTVATLDDVVVENSETFTVALSASNALVDANDTATGTIANDDVESTVIETRVSAGSDDAEERPTGSMTLTSSDLELTVDGTNQQIVGMRFTDLNVPHGALIQNAYLQFQADETDSDPTSLSIFAEAVDNATTFIDTSGDISGRTKTNSSTPWSPVPWDTRAEAGPNQQTPNIASVIQEIVNRPGWSAGNALAIIVTGTGHRTAESFDSDPNAAPLLHIEYVTGVNHPLTTSGIADVNVNTDAPDTVVDLFAAFDDFEDPDSALTFTIEENTNPALFNSTTLDGVLGTLTLDFAPATNGNADITIRVTDTGTPPSSVETTFSVSVSPFNQAPTTTGLADVFVTEDVDDTAIDLFAAFDDLEDPASELTYTVEANTNSALFTSTNIDGALGTLSLDYAPDASGTANITVRATDSGYPVFFVETSFTVGISEVNDTPKISSGAVDNLIIVQNSPATPLGLAGLGYGPGGGADEGGQTLSYSVTSVPSPAIGDIVLSDGSTVVTPGAYSLDQIQGMQFLAAANVYGESATFSFTVTDNGTTNGVADFKTLNQSLVINVVENTPPTVVEVRVSARSDDAEERSSGIVKFTSKDVELVDDPTHSGNQQTVGIRFTGLSIPQGAIITSAFVQFEAGGADDEVTSLQFHGEATDNAVTFDTTDFSITTRPVTNASVGWEPPEWTTVGEAGAIQKTPDIASVIQEIVDRPGWAAGNALALFVTGYGERKAVSYDGDVVNGTTGAPLIHVEYVTGSPLMLQSTASPPLSAATIDESQLSAIVDEAILQLSRSHNPEVESRLSVLNFEVVDLPGNLLGRTWGNTIQIDADAAGFGWFVDMTPDDNSEFWYDGAAHQLVANAGSQASQQVDLLTVVMHELGHVLELEHTDTNNVMDSQLSLGTRRLSDGGFSDA